MDPERELLRRITDIDLFIRSLFFDDNLTDWTLARDFGHLMTRLNPEILTGYLVLVRAYRHLGELKLAATNVEQCHTLLARGNVGESEREVLIPILMGEEKLLSSASPPQP